MAVIWMVIATCAAACGVGYLIAGVRQWQGKGRPLSYWLRGRTLKDAEALGCADEPYAAGRRDGRELRGVTVP